VPAAEPSVFGGGTAQPIASAYVGWHGGEFEASRVEQPVGGLDTAAVRS